MSQTNQTLWDMLQDSPGGNPVFGILNSALQKQNSGSGRFGELGAAGLDSLFDWLNTSRTSNKGKVDPNTLRTDGSAKGPGYFGTLPRPDGRVSTELSVGVESDGNNWLIPALVPTLNKTQVDTLLNMPPNGKIPPEIMERVYKHALYRKGQGKSPFADSPMSETERNQVNGAMEIDYRKSLPQQLELDRPTPWLHQGSPINGKNFITNPNVADFRNMRNR